MRAIYTTRFRRLVMPVSCRAMLLVMCVVSACTTQRVITTSDGYGLEPPRKPLIVARIGDQSLLSWKSEIGETYTILYADGPRLGGEWKPLPGAMGLKGTGVEMRLEDTLPRNKPRHYRLMIIPSNER